MDMFSKFTLSHFIWYLVPGLGFIFFLLFPIVVLYPQISKEFIVTVGPFSLLLLGVILGFFLDGLRLYRFRPSYSKIKNDFFFNLKNVTDLDMDPYLIQSLVSDIARNKNINGLSLSHAIWIMLGHFTILGFVEGFFWLLNALYFIFQKSMPLQLFGSNVSSATFIFSCIAFGIMFVLIGVRLHFISIEDQQTTNNKFLTFAEHNKEEIRELLSSRFRNN